MKMLNALYVAESLPKRLSHQNKGDFGHVLVVGGSLGMAGSVCMAAEGALRAGAGLVTVAVPQDIVPAVSVKLTECMVLPLPSENGVLGLKAVSVLLPFLKRVNTVVVGMGARVCPGLLAVLEALLSGFAGRVLIDADGLNVLAQHMYLLHEKRCAEVILTPHPGEMARLSGLSVADIQQNRLQTAERMAQSHKAIVVLKGEKTLITDGENTLCNPTGNPGMATGGSGDVLAGIIGGLLAQHMGALPASACGCYLHGLAGDIAASEKTVYGLIARDLIAYLPSAFRKIL